MPGESPAPAVCSHPQRNPVGFVHLRDHVGQLGTKGGLVFVVIADGGLVVIHARRVSFDVDQFGAVDHPHIVVRRGQHRTELLQRLALSPNKTELLVGNSWHRSSSGRGTRRSSLGTFGHCRIQSQLLVDLETEDGSFGSYRRSWHSGREWTSHPSPPAAWPAPVPRHAPCCDRLLPRNL